LHSPATTAALALAVRDRLATQRYRVLAEAWATAPQDTPLSSAT
jgi:hypothetical protein